MCAFYLEKELKIANLFNNSLSCWNTRAVGPWKFTTIFTAMKKYIQTKSKSNQQSEKIGMYKNEYIAYIYFAQLLFIYFLLEKVKVYLLQKWPMTNS